MFGDQPLWFSQRSLSEVGSARDDVIGRLAHVLASRSRRCGRATRRARSGASTWSICSVIQCGSPSTSGVLPERAVGLLHAPQVVEQSPARPARSPATCLRSGDVVQVAWPDEVVGAGVGAVLERQRAPYPRHAGRGDRGTAVGLVLGRRQHHQRLLVQAPHVLRLAHGARRPAHRLQVVRPAARVAPRRRLEAPARGRRACGSRVGPEADRQRQVAPVHAVEPRLRRLHDVAGRRRVVRGVEVAVLEVGARVAGRTGVTAGGAPQSRRRADRRGHRVVERHQRGRPREPEVVVAVVAGRRVGDHEQLQRAAGERAEAHAGQHRCASRVGDPGRLEPPAGPARDLPVGERARDRLHAPAPGQLTAAVGDHELEVAQARGREVRVVDLGQLALPEREPHRAAALLDRPAEALLVRGCPRVLLTGRARSGRLGRGGRRPEGEQQRDGDEGAERHEVRFARWAPAGNRWPPAPRRARRARRRPSPSGDRVRARASAPSCRAARARRSRARRGPRPRRPPA